MSTFRKSLLLSSFLHLSLLLSLWFFLRGDSVERATGDEGSEVIYISFKTGSLNKGASELVEKSVSEAPASAGDIINAGAESRAGVLGPSPKQPASFRNQRAEAFINEPGDGGQGGSSDILRQIRVKIERAKFYPLMAKRSRIEGTPEIELKLKTDGSIESLSLKKSCGFPILDEAALATVRQAAPFPFYADPIALGIQYELKD